MLEKELATIGWSDLQALVNTRRREDDGIEYKVSFRGSDDLATLNDNQRQNAVGAIAREAIAFLNTRGGDILIGVEEDNHGAAIGTPGVARPLETAERLARSLAALIEPAQTNIAVTGIADPADPERGVVFARVRPSLRAPHRSMRDRECYVRRGSESIPMAMDEIQDLTLYRTDMRRERLELLGKQFDDFERGFVDQEQVGPRSFHVRLVAQPLVEQEIDVEPLLPYLMAAGTPYFSPTGKQLTNDVAFRGINSRWRPILRGRKQWGVNRTDAEEGENVSIIARQVKTSGMMQFDFAATVNWKGKTIVDESWLHGFFADVFNGLEAATRHLPTILPSTIRVGVRSRGGVSLATGSSMFPEYTSIPNQLIMLPDAYIQTTADLDELFVQLQIDIGALVGIERELPVVRRKPTDVS